MDKNRYLIAAAGAGKTTTIVQDALSKSGGVLLVTFTEANRDEIIKKVIEKVGHVPRNITILTWFTFLIQHGVKPYQGSYHASFQEYQFNGLILCQNGKEGKRQIQQGTKKVWVYIKSEQEDPIVHYSSKDGRLYSDRLPKLVTRINAKSKGKLFQRIEKLFPNLYIDEVQDLSGYDLEILKLMFASKASISLVGDPRQYVFSTHRENKYAAYGNGKIREFIQNECTSLEVACKIDDVTLNVSHRNSPEICYLSSLLYQDQYPRVTACSCPTCCALRMGGEIKVVTKTEATHILLSNPSIVQLIYDKRTVLLSNGHKSLNMGLSKGITFDSIMIYPTKEMKNWLIDHRTILKDITKAKFYIAITRARKNVYFVFDDNEMIPQLASLEPYK